MLGHSSLTRLGNSSLTTNPYRWFSEKKVTREEVSFAPHEADVRLSLGFSDDSHAFFRDRKPTLWKLGWSSPCLGKFLTSTPYRWALITIFRTQGITVYSSTGAPRFTVTGSLVLMARQPLVTSKVGGGWRPALSNWVFPVGALASGLS